MRHDWTKRRSPQAIEPAHAARGGLRRTPGRVVDQNNDLASASPADPRRREVNPVKAPQRRKPAHPTHARPISDSLGRVPVVEPKR